MSFALLRSPFSPCSISGLMGENPFQKCSFWWCWLFLVSEEQLQLPCQIPQRFKGPVHCLRGPLIPLETPISTPVKVGAHQPLNCNEHNPRQVQNNNENSLLVNSGIHLYTSTYQPLTQPQTPTRSLQAHLSKTTSIHFNSLVIKFLISEGNPILFPRQTLSPQ